MDNNNKENDENSVRVAVRIRPQISRELIDMCQICTTVTPNEPQIWLGKDKAFTYDYVFDTDSRQFQIYETCVQGLVEGCFSGYNATVLAYGQTGSGKTYTMGIGFEPSSQIQLDDDSQGIVPRAVNHLFSGIERRKLEAREKNQLAPEFKVKAQFIELYNEDIIDLLDETHDSYSNSKQIRILEENGTIAMTGVTSKPVGSMIEAFECLRIGSLSRTTASTQMNTQSSRSHAIFTLSIDQTRVACETHDVETLTAKFHFVDLAGSERLKRTGATGERAREGISINTGLLCLGNVISALDKSKKSTHVPYRDSKLTRLLQDSLGGNSQTLMIACISPSDCDIMESLSTLRYANRAKNIKNKVVVNQDTSSHIIASLRKQNQELLLELTELKQGKRIIGVDGSEHLNDMYYENTMLKTENQNLKTRNKALQESNERLISESANFLAENTYSPEFKDIIQNYLLQIDELNVKLLEQEETIMHLRKHHQNVHNRSSIIPNQNDTEITSDKVIQDAKREVKKMKALIHNGTKLIHNGAREHSLTTDRSLEHRGFSANAYESCDSNVASDNDENDEERHDDHEHADREANDEDGDCEENSSEEASGDNSLEHVKLELDQLNDNISTKELLIAELEKSQRRMQSLKHHYESKLIQLQNQISEIEKERDQVLMKLTQGGNKTDEKTKKVHDDYDKRIKGLQSDLKKLQVAKKDHADAMRKQARYESQINKLRNEVGDMKRQKVSVMHKMKEEASKHRASEMDSNKRIAQLLKQHRQKDLRIRNLEYDVNRMKSNLGRREAELKSLRMKLKNKAQVGPLNVKYFVNSCEKARRMTRTPRELLFAD